MRESFVKSFFSNQFLVAIVVVVFGWFLLEIRGILVALFISYIIMAGFSPAVEFLRQYKIPKVVAVLLTYVTALAVLVILILPLIPFFSAQMQALINIFPTYLDQAARLLGIQVDSAVFRGYITSEFGTIGRNAFALTGRVLGGLFSMLTVLVVSFYLLLDGDRIKRNIAELFPSKFQEQVGRVLSQVEYKLGAWVRGQIVLSIVIGVVTWIALTILGIEFALPLALLAGMLEIVPTIGPIISSIPAIIVAITISPTMAFIVIGIYIAIQMLENNLLVPKIMEKAVGLNPILIIIAVMIGANLMGVIGALLSIPFVSMLTILFKEVRNTSS